MKIQTGSLNRMILMVMIIYHENSSGDWYKREYDSKGNQIYYENSDGVIINNRPQSIPEYTMEQLTEMLGKEFKIKK